MVSGFHVCQGLQTLFTLMGFNSRERPVSFLANRTGMGLLWFMSDESGSHESGEFVWHLASGIFRVPTHTGYSLNLSQIARVNGTETKKEREKGSTRPSTKMSLNF